MGGAAHKSFMHSSFHAEIKESLDQKTPDIVELHQGMTEPMSEIHHAIVQCMSTTLSELKRANTMVSISSVSCATTY